MHNNVMLWFEVVLVLIAQPILAQPNLQDACRASTIWAHVDDEAKIAALSRVDDPRKVGSCARDEDWFQPASHAFCSGQRDGGCHSGP